MRPWHAHAQVTFADPASTAKSVAFAHAAGPGMAWVPLGTMALRAHGDSRLQHVIKLGGGTSLQRYLRITLSGMLAAPGSGGRRRTCSALLLCSKAASSARPDLGESNMHAMKCAAMHVARKHARHCAVPEMCWMHAWA